MEDFNTKTNNLLEILSQDNPDIYTLSQRDSTSLINELKPKEPSTKKPQIKFILTKHQSLSVNLLQKKTSSKHSESNIETENGNNGRWNKDEQKRFAEAILLYGNDWKKIQNHISSRNITQIRSHAQKFLMKLKQKELLKEKGLDKNLSWTKIVNFLRRTLTNDELKNVLFSVEQNVNKKNRNKKLKKLKKINCKKNLEENKENVLNKLLCFDDIEEQNRKAEEEEKDLQKFMECFNSYGSTTLYSSFDENSINNGENNFGYNVINEQRNKYNNIL